MTREQLRNQVLNGYYRLTSYTLDQRAYALGIDAAAAWLALDELNETALRFLMQLLAYSGRSGEALAQYEQVVVLLDAELSVPPEQASRELALKIGQGDLAAPVAQVKREVLHNLPREMGLFFGRTQQLHTLKNDLLTRSYPAITLSGSGGIGKTSLALAVGRALIADPSQRYSDGIWFIDLADIENAPLAKVQTLVAAAIGQALDLSFHTQNDIWSQCLAQLAPKNLPLILDNVEQFRAVASDLMLAILNAGKQINLLVTSRATLALSANRKMALRGLETPTTLAADAAENERTAALENASVQLFAERATQHPTHFELEQSLPEIIAICQFVEGLPLGIELAAAALGRMTLAEILPALSDNLRLIDQAQPFLPTRQRTLQAVFDTSWQLLDPREQTALAQISIFRGGFMRPAAVALLGDAASSLFHLQHHALLGREASGRFRLHPLLRQRAAAKLDAPARADLAEQSKTKHSSYYCRFIQGFQDALQRGVAAEALTEILPEQANLRLAWQNAVAAKQWRLIADALDAAHTFYERKGLFREAAARADEAIAQIETLPERDTPVATLYGRLLSERAWNYISFAEFDVAREAAEQAIEIGRAVADAEVEARARCMLGQVHGRQNDHAPALDQFEQAHALAETTSNLFLQADTWIGIGSRRLYMPDFRPAQAPLAHALGMCQELQYKRGEMEALHYLGTFAHFTEDFDQFKLHTEAFLTLSRELGHVIGEAEGLGSIGVSLKAQREQALPALAGLALVALRLDDKEKAAAHAEQVWLAWQEMVDSAERADLKLYQRLGLVWDALDDARATDLWQRASELLQQRSEKLPDPTARALYLEQVPAHRAIAHHSPT